MSISLPVYTKADETVITTAHVAVAAVIVDLPNAAGRITLNVYPSAGAKNRGKPPADQINIALGEVFDGGNTMPTLAILAANDAQFATAWNRVVRKLEDAAAIAHPALRSGTVN